MDKIITSPILMDTNIIDFQALAEAIPLMFWLIDNKGKNIFSNKIYKTFLSLKAIEENDGNVWLEALHPNDQKFCLKTIDQALKMQTSFVLEYRLKRHDGNYRYIIDRGKPYTNQEGCFAGLIRSSTDITDRKILEDKLKESHRMSLNLRDSLTRQSIRDPLTSLFNRGYMEESLRREISRCQRAGEGVGVIRVDIDHFNKFNDDHGRDAGDVVLVAFSKFMTEYFRQSDIVCRLGGEEFIVVMPSAPQSLVVERATQLCHKLHDVKTYYYGTPLSAIRASFGVAYLAGDDDEQACTIVKLAEVALEQAKRAGRDQVEVYDSTKHAVAEQVMSGSGSIH